MKALALVPGPKTLLLNMNITTVIIVIANSWQQVPVLLPARGLRNGRAYRSSRCRRTDSDSNIDNAYVFVLYELFFFSVYAFIMYKTVLLVSLLLFFLLTLLMMMYKNKN